MATEFGIMNPEDRALMLSNEKSLWLNVAKFEQCTRIASMLSKTDFIPISFKDNVGNCMVALDLAERMGMHPIMLMQSMYVIKGRPGFEGKFMAALINNSGRYKNPLEYEWRGTQGKPEWGCRAFAVRKSTDKTVYGPWVDWKMVHGEGWASRTGSKWVTMPELMFMYRAASFFVNVNDSDLRMGMPTKEEIEDVTDVVPTATGVYEKPAGKKKNKKMYQPIEKPIEMSAEDVEAVNKVAMEVIPESMEDGSDDCEQETDIKEEVEISREMKRFNEIWYEGDRDAVKHASKEMKTFGSRPKEDQLTDWLKYYDEYLEEKVGELAVIITTPDKDSEETPF